MRRLVLFLLAATCIAAELSDDQLTIYGKEIFNDCTTCNLQNAAKGHKELMKQITTGIAMLPNTLKTKALLLIRDWTAKLARNPLSDCTKLCQNINATRKACNAIDIVSQHFDDQLLIYHAEEVKKCKGNKDCLAEESASNELIVLGIKQMELAISTYADSNDACDAPVKSELMLQNGPAKLLGCKICRATLDFVHKTVVGGQSETSKNFIKSISDAGVNACNKMKITKILNFLAEFLGRSSVCKEVPGLVEVLFKKVIAPYFNEKAPQTCGVFFGQC